MVNRLTEENVKEIAKMFRDGRNTGEIAEGLNVTEGQVKSAIRRLRKLGVKMPKDRNFYERVAKELSEEKEEKEED